MDTNHSDTSHPVDPPSSVPSHGTGQTSSNPFGGAHSSLPSSPSQQSSIHPPTGSGPVASSHIEPPHQEHPVGGHTPPEHPPHHKGVPILLVILLLIFAFFGGLLLATWYFQNQLQKTQITAATPTPQPTTTAKTLIIGTDPTFQPMEYMDPQGKLIGYDIDLGDRIADELGVQVEYKNVPWDSLFAALDKSQVDMILSGVTITDERKEKYEFSDPYLNAGQVIIALKENTSIASSSSLRGKRIGVQENTTNAEEAVKLTDPNLVMKYPDFLQATQALVNGQVDAILSDLPAAKGTITANPSLKIASDPFTNEYYGIVFRKGDPRVQEINQILRTLQTQGVLTDLKQKWLD